MMLDLEQSARVFALGALLLCAACGQPPAAEGEPELVASEQAAARRSAQAQTARIVRDVEVETLGKRVAVLEAEIERLKGHHAGAGVLDIEQRLAALEAKADAPPPTPAATPPAAPKTSKPSGGKAAPAVKSKPASE